MLSHSYSVYATSQQPLRNKLRVANENVPRTDEADDHGRDRPKFRTRRKKAEPDGRNGAQPAMARRLAWLCSRTVPIMYSEYSSHRRISTPASSAWL